jgi:tetratricopeptide (TPR) repeat protein
MQLACAVMTVDPRSTLAASSDAPSEAAKEKYGKALKAYGANRYADALLLLEDVRRLHSSPNALLLLGHCYAKLGRMASAIDAYREAERSAAEQIAKVKDASGSLKETRGSALEHMADLESHVPYITLVMPSDLPTDFSLLLDGKPLPADKWGTALPVDPGGHEVAASGSRIEPYKQSIFAKEGDKQRVELNLQREASAKVVVELPSRVTPSDATMLVDGQKQAIAGTTTTLLLAPGPHSIVIRAPNRKTFVHSGGLSNGESVLLRPTLYRAAPKWATIMGGGVALVCLGIATGLMAHAYQQENQALEAAMKVNATSEDAQAKIDTRTSIRNQWIAGVVLFSTGGSLAISTAGLSFATEWR